MFALLLLLFSIALVVDGGAVGECRSECVEQNRYKIVRVHLKDDLVMVGICRNTTLSDDGYKSIVVPMICNRHHGIWTIDTESTLIQVNYVNANSVFSDIFNNEHLWIRIR
ncbi:unnamed protein product [Cylicostephanus goldi]|uniref:Ricin B lectin domain-containing protein n=1 Tax=Cylicostephanus goldi TaxID=71465 RepID=A0A3P6R810_CYLGO|nr:unnamed protein product [Cylicostephanus goldi]